MSDEEALRIHLSRPERMQGDRPALPPDEWFRGDTPTLLKVKRNMFTHSGTVENEYGLQSVVRLFWLENTRLWTDGNRLFWADSGNRILHLGGRLLLDTIKPIGEKIQ